MTGESNRSTDAKSYSKQGTVGYCEAMRMIFILIFQGGKKMFNFTIKRLKKAALPPGTSIYVVKRKQRK